MSIKDILNIEFDQEFEEELFEQLLDENIPRDLLKAYRIAYKADAGGVGDQSQHSMHDEIGADSPTDKRRFASWDYGKSNYEELTPEEALAYLGIPGAKQSEVAEKLPNLRLLYNGHLAEWENHNGKIYYLYYTDIPWDRFRAIGFGGFKGKGMYTNDTKFAQKVSDIEACIKTADKIYKTDEYEHPLYNDETRKQKQKAQEFNILRDYSKYAPEERPSDYDSHKPYHNFKIDPQFVVDTPDTGAHNKELIYRANDSSDFYLNGKVRRYYKPYIKLLNEKSVLRNKLQNYTAIYKKLVREKDTYDEETYQRKEEKIKQAIKDAREEYENKIIEIKNMEKTLNRDLSQKIIDFNQNVLGQYLKKWEDVLTRGYELEKAITAEKASSETGDKGGMELLEDEIRKLIKALEQDKENFNSLKIKGSNENTPEATQENLKKLSDKLDELEALKEDRVIRHLEQLRELETQLTQTNTEWAQIRKKEAEMKAQRQAKNKVNDLDPKLSSIIQFKDLGPGEVDSTLTR